MKKWIRVMCVLMVLLMTLLPVFGTVSAESVSEDEESPVDFVILLDCSSSLGVNDPSDLCLEACKSFVDKLPFQGARVSVIAFGYRDKDDKNGFTYSAKYNIVWKEDAELVHEIVPLGSMKDAETKDLYKEKVSHAYDVSRTSKTWTPIGHAVAAAVDVLERGGAADGKACIILLSDGVNSPNTKYQDEEMIEPASKLAGQHKWPVYAVELNYGNDNAAEVKAAEELLDTICSNSGDRKIARQSCGKSEDVHVAFERIFADFYGLAQPEFKVIELPGEYEFEVPYLTSEITVSIFGAGVNSVVLSKESGGTATEIKDDIVSDTLVASVEPNSYYSIKMICPEEGKWKVVLNGDGIVKAKVLVSNSALHEMDLKMTAAASADAHDLTKNDKISVDACFYYRNIDVTKSQFYNLVPAKLMVVGTNGVSKEFEMDSSTGGYHYDLSLRDVPSGSFNLQVIVTDNSFRSGRKVSNTVGTFTMRNEDVQFKSTAPITLRAFLNSQFERIDLNEIFENPDHDPIEYLVTCESDRTVQLDYTLNADAGYLDFMTGLTPCEYDVSISAKDKEMSEWLKYDGLKLIVENRAPFAQPVADVELWSDYYPDFMQTHGDTTAQIDLNSVFADPEGLPGTFAASVDNSEAVSVVLSDGILTINPLTEGDATVTIVCSDGFEETSSSVRINVISGIKLYWSTNWIWYVIGAIIALIVIMILVVLFKNKRVKGTWEVTLNDDGIEATVQQINIANFTNCGRKSNFRLIDLVNELLPYMDRPMQGFVTRFFTGTGAENIRLVGVIGSRGCKIDRIPRGNTATRVYVNGVQKTGGSAKMNAGSIDIVVASDGNSQMALTMRLQ